MSTTTSTVVSGRRRSISLTRLFELSRFDEVLRPENQSRSVVTLPARQSAAKTARFSAPEFEPWLAALPHGQPFPITDRFSEIADIVGNSVQEVLAKRKTPQQAADDAAARINKLM